MLNFYFFKKLLICTIFPYLSSLLKFVKMQKASHVIVAVAVVAVANET